jgi:uncharacterized protein (TIGR02594 family)
MNEEIKEWQRIIGVDDDGVFGPNTLKASKGAFGLHEVVPNDPPWIYEGRKVIGLHEVRDNYVLRTWLYSDGSRLGDPAQLPWCGDFAETAMKRGLPGEVFTGVMKENPYYAQNWAYFGVETQPVYGCVVVFKRPGGGHVGFAVGQDNLNYMVLGGNQGDKVSVVPVPKARCIATRWPSSYANPKVPLPFIKSDQLPSMNEA